MILVHISRLPLTQTLLSPIQPAPLFSRLQQRVVNAVSNQEAFSVRGFFKSGDTHGREAAQLGGKPVLAGKQGRLKG